jgi:hypothetical protein
VDRFEKCDKNCSAWLDSTEDVVHQNRWSKKLRSFYDCIYHQIEGVKSYVIDVLNDGHLLYLVVLAKRLGIHIS